MRREEGLLHRRSVALPSKVQYAKQSRKELGKMYSTRKQDNLTSDRMIAMAAAIVRSAKATPSP